ncbi:hypothetical protein LUZ60_006358 [Juncus effusus]|nr:hypothetical protein LUZ60_006358 [Juncus effusus]
MVESSLFSFLEERQSGSNLVMDTAELTKIIYTRIQRFEPENVAKIFGCIFLREPDEHDMMQLAYGSDVTLISHINDAKSTLAILSSRTSSQIQCPNPNPNFNPTYFPLMGLRDNNNININNNINNVPAKPNVQFYDPYEHHHNYARNMTDSQLVGFDEQYDTMNNLSSYMSNLNMYHDPTAVQRRVVKPTQIPKRPCHYYIKGMCKNGLNCNYAHHTIPLEFLESETGTGGTSGTGGGTSIGTPDELEKLEMEIVKLLRSNPRQPVSIASLPTLYGEMYGKNIQAEGYLTESQRHGKSGYSLTKLLCRLTKIVVMERPHGQHTVVLAEDAYKFLECGNEKMDGTQNPASSHQIYLTFPADSTFTEEDVQTYFSQYGPVRDVRIPCQDRRMFGFVSFHNPDTVHVILANRHPHFICGARVLVKPYREKTKNFMMDKMKPPFGYNPHHTDIDPELYPMPGDMEASMIMKRQLLENQERMSQLELERMRLNDFSYLNSSVDNFKFISDDKEFDSIDPVRYALDAFNNGNSTSSDSSALHISGNSTENESCHVELPENPFGSTP